MRKILFVMFVMLTVLPAVLFSAPPVRFQLDSRYGMLPEQGPLELQVVINLVGGQGADDDNGPLDLAVVIDRSGSMSGKKLEDVKTAALQLLDRLSDKDRVTLISYSSSVEIHLNGVAADSDGKDRLAAEIRSLNAGGITALGPAMIRAFKNLRSMERTRDRSAHVVLLSDGRANHGITDPDVLGERARSAFLDGISLSTLGVGMDYNEDLMTKLADEGGGRYHFIKNSDEVAKVLEDELQGLRSTVAKSIRLRLYPGEGVQVKQIYGYAAVQKSGYSEISVGSLAARQKRSILVSLAVDSRQVVRRLVARCEVLYQVTAGKGVWQKKQQVESLTLRQAKSAAQFAASENSKVAVRAIRVYSADRIDAAMKAVTARQYKKAKKILRQEETRLRTALRKRFVQPLKKQLQLVQKAMQQMKRAQNDYRYRKRYLKEQKSQMYKLKK